MDLDKKMNLESEPKAPQYRPLIRHQQALILVIDSFVKKSQMAKVMGKADRG
jgi:hypothetical protein